MRAKRSQRPTQIALDWFPEKFQHENGIANQVAPPVQARRVFCDIWHSQPAGLLLILLVLAGAALNGCAGFVSGANTSPTSTTMVIANVQAASTTTSSVQVLWTTNVAADSVVNYGTTTSYGSSTPVDPTMVTSHVETISGLAAGTTYYYQVQSTDSKSNNGKSGGHKFTTVGFNISGTITPTQGGSGATVTLSGASSATTTANGSGAYTFTGLPSGTYTITPSNTGYTFTPANQNVTVSTASLTGVNFTASVTATAPTITTEPVNQTVTAGQTATFTVVASGTAPLSYQWQKNGANITAATSSSYTTPATTTSDSGSTFDVVVSNTAGGVTSSGAGLTVNPTPALIMATPSSASFGNVVTDISNSLSITLINSGGSSATISQAVLSGTGFSTNLSIPVTIAAGGNATFNAVFAPTTAGSVTGSISLVSNASNSPLVISLSGSGVAPTFLMGASPTSLSFGNVNVGTSNTLNTTLTNNGNSNVTISSITTLGAGLSASGVASGTVLTPNQTITLNATFTPAAVGSVTGAISVASNATNSPTVITVTGTGVQLSTGTQFYVSTSGNDANSGTSLSAPWRTIQNAMNNATPGSTVNILAGTYNERLTLGVSGTAGNYITFQPYNFSVPTGGCSGYTGVACGGDQVILDYTYLGTVTDGVPFLLISGKSYVRIQGLTFQNFTNNGASQQGVRVDNASNFVEFNYNKFLNNKNIGPWNGCCAFLHIRLWTSSNVLFHGNEIGYVVTNYSEAMTADSGSTGFTAEYNWIHDTDAIAIDVHNGANNYTIRGNKLEYISIKRDGTVWYNNPAVAIYNDGGNTGVMERNSINHAGVGLQALAEPGMPAAHDVIIRNNIVENCNQQGIVIGTWYSNTDGSTVYNINVFNNTFYGNTNGVVIRPMTSATVAWENNIFSNNGTNYVNTLNWNPGTTSYNLYFSGGTGPGSNNVTSDPLFNNPALGDFTLQGTSPAINVGDPNTLSSIAGTVDFAGNPRFLNGQIDMGAYEH
jgi:HYDIN/CFA65/VesB family protein/uncharacterized protein DUF5123/carboxypeptidase family protein/Ig-like domain-containing protein